MSPAILIFLPAPNGNPSAVANNSTLSPTSILITHLSRKCNPKPLGPYTLEHRLLVDTSSLLPGHVASRRYTHFLTLSSQFPGKTFVGTSAVTPINAATLNKSANESTIKQTDSSEMTLIAIPSQPDNFLPLLMQRMSPLWVPRQAHRVEGGTSFIINDWKIRIGELRISGGRGQGRVRGCVCELEPLFIDDDKERDDAEMAGLARVFFENVVQDSGVDIHEMKIVGPVAGGRDGLVRQYLDFLTFART
jgi:hypothetical protein